MAVDTVSIELLSAINSLITGKNTGNFLDFGLVASAGITSIGLHSGHLLRSCPQSSL
jgi:hypothetical protein